jgi:hypothetical protein
LNVYHGPDLDGAPTAGRKFVGDFNGVIQVPNVDQEVAA